MIETLITFLQVNVLPWGLLGVFVASVVEEVIAPIPSALIMTMSGFLLVTGPVSASSLGALIFKVALPAALGVTLGSYIVYFTVRYGGKFVVEKWGRFLGLYWSDIEKLQIRLSGTKKDETVIMMVRVIPIVPSVAISALCGVLGMPILKYFVITFAGMFVRALLLGAIGWQVGSVYERYAQIIGHLEKYLIIGLVLFVALWLVPKIIRKYS